MPADPHTIVSTRVFASPCESLFAAFADPTRLARWWGPTGFTATMHEFDLRSGGRWRLTLHGPDGGSYENESEFVTVAPLGRIVLRHLDPVHAFQMTMSFTSEPGGTRLTWSMRFDSASEYDRVRAIIIAANEQNFDRLAAHLAESA
jgi:uncharacterized protein YndB with AHSA1/START domain